VTRTGAQRVASFIDLYEILRPDPDDGALAGLEALADEYRVAVTHGIVTSREALLSIAEGV
jgi:hypothetical protein